MQIYRQDWKGTRTTSALVAGVWKPVSFSLELITWVPMPILSIFYFHVKNAEM